MKYFLTFLRLFIWCLYTWERMLEQMEQEGVGFYLNGKKTAPREIIRTCCMREKAVYMPDFVMDEEGKLCEVRYDEVTKW